MVSFGVLSLNISEMKGMAGMTAGAIESETEAVFRHNEICMVCVLIGFILSIVGSIQEYCDRIRDGAWGGEPEIIAASLLYDVTVTVYEMQNGQLMVH